MTKDTRRVDELEIGDIVNPPYDKSVLTVESIEKVGWKVNKVYYVGIRDPWHYGTTEEFTYLGNKKEEEIMKTQKVDCSVLYPYFDSLVNEETTLKHTNIPVYVRQQLKNIYELFEDVLGLTLEEVKTLYFERKMSKQEVKSEYKKFPKTVLKKVKDLQPGDKVVIPNMGDGVVTKLVEDNFGSDKSLIRVEWVCDNAVRVNLLNKERELVLLN